MSTNSRLMCMSTTNFSDVACEFVRLAVLARPGALGGASALARLEATLLPFTTPLHPFDGGVLARPIESFECATIASPPRPPAHAFSSDLTLSAALLRSSATASNEPNAIAPRPSPAPISRLPLPSGIIKYKPEKRITMPKMNNGT